LYQLLSGKKYIALAITEAFAGSDVRGLQTTATRDGDFWVVTGTKKCVVMTVIPSLHLMMTT
jgi:alkylation response protein AidB-like acyl-CoA dehydrogenase